jgi:hypothetical protein
VPTAMDDFRIEFSVNQSIVSYFTRRERDKKPQTMDGDSKASMNEIKKL